MDDNAISKILSGESRDIQNLRDHIGIVKDFLVLVNRIDALPEANRRLEGISPFQAVVKDVPIQKLDGFLIAFFGAPAKRPGIPTPLKLKFNPVVKYLGEIRTEQALYLRKVKTGVFYGAIWPWVRKPEFQTLHLGYYSKTLSDADFQQLEELIRKSTHQRLVGEMEAGIGGQIHGISLPAFLQMSEMEKTTATLKIKGKNNSGRLFLKDGHLINAETEGLRGRDAAYRIISWDNASIEIDRASPQRQNVIKEPLMHVLMESLKIKDEEAYQRQGEDTAAEEMEGEAPAEDAPPEDHGREGGRQTAEDETFVIKEKKQSTIRRWLHDPVKKRRLMICAAAAASVLFFILGTVFITRMVHSNRLKDNYEALLKEVDRQDAFKEKAMLLKLFINSQDPNEYTQMAQQKLAELKVVMDDRLYSEVVKKVDALPLTFDYDTKARALYSQYLEQFPDGKHAAKIKEGMAAIPEVIDDTQYDYLTRHPWESEDEKIAAHKAYLINHPNGKHREAVEAVLVGIIEADYAAINRQKSICEEQKDWSACIARCDRFLTHFDNTYRTGEVKDLRAAFQGRQDLKRLAEAAASKGGDTAAAKRIYTDFLAENPDATIRNEVAAEIARLDALIDAESSWRAALAYSRDPANPISDQIEKVDAFIDNHKSSPYYEEARDLLVKLRQEKAAEDKKRVAELAHAQKAEQLRKEMLAKEQLKNRLNRETRRMGERLKTSGGRYQANGNGTFTDTETGKTWCLLDSTTVLGKCIDYKTARQYVTNLSTGGFTDWRLPTSGELARIYKHPPFFPAIGFRRFWTSEAVVKGYHELVAVISSEKESVFEREYLGTDDCATVQAVRP